MWSEEEREIGRCRAREKVSKREGERSNWKVCVRERDRERERVRDEAKREA